MTYDYALLGERLRWVLELPDEGDDYGYYDVPEEPAREIKVEQPKNVRSVYGGPWSPADLRLPWQERR